MPGFPQPAMVEMLEGQGRAGKYSNQGKPSVCSCGGQHDEALLFYLFDSLLVSVICDIMHKRDTLIAVES